jgi:hypothetical protein
MTRAARSAVAALLAAAVLGAGCAKSADTAEVVAPSGASAGTDANGAATTTTLIPASVAGVSATRSPGGESTTAAGNPDLAGAAGQLISRLAADPTLIQQILGGDTADLERLTGLDAATLARLRITPESIRGLASVLSRLDPTVLAQLASSGGRTNSDIAQTILLLASPLDPTTYAAIKGIDPRFLSLLASTASSVDPKVAESLGAVLAVVDPNGLGKLAGDRTSLGLIAVLFAAALRTDPATFAQLGNAAQVDPALQNVIDGIRQLAAGLTPEFVANVNQLSTVLGPEVLDALGKAIGFLGSEEYGPIITEAAKDPVVVASVLAVASLLIPGLPEALSPDVFGNDPTARSRALVGVIALVLANQNGIDLTQLATLLGLTPPG